MRAGIAFGSNLGDRLEILRRARACLLASPLLAPPILLSGIYLTSPVDCPAGSEPFLNSVLEAELTGDPVALLRDLRACERGLGRPARSPRNAPRVIDLDLLYAGDWNIKTDDLVLPHPQIAGRRFVLAPLAEIRPELILPGQSETVAQLLAKLPAGNSAELLDAKW
ncbi:MAG: 2-amino-4-hydroxy-6-hydroxymethyldihydropteridine diphosphokinase [Chthoniobacteraceae bacterium]|jgi:2-amino-4-hydroxy-6-hydroxymethyldihydropteridine diphosphokinase